MGQARSSFYIYPLVSKMTLRCERKMPYPILEHRYRCPKPFGNEYSKDGLVKKIVQLASQELRTSKIYSDAVGDVCRSRAI
jgi:hypothetical protein